MASLRLALPLHWAKNEGTCTGFKGPRPLQEPRFVRICGALLPVGDDFDGTAAHETAAGLGLLLHFTQLAARYLGVPLLHDAAFRGSTSSVWPRRGIGKEAEANELPLYDAHHNAALVARPPASIASLARGIGRLVTTDTSAASSECGFFGTVQHAALRLLRRSIGTVCAAELSSTGCTPPAWGAVTLLAALAAGVARKEGPQQSLRDTEEEEEDWTIVPLQPCGQ